MPKKQGWLAPGEIKEMVYRCVMRSGQGRDSWPTQGVALTKEVHGYLIWTFDNRLSKDVPDERTEHWVPNRFVLDRDEAVEAAVDRAMQLEEFSP